MNSKFRWHCNAKLLGNGFCLAWNDLDDSFGPNWNKIEKCSVQYIPANQNKRDLYRFIFKSIRTGSEFCIVENSTIAASFAETDSDAAAHPERLRRTDTASPVFQCMSSGSSGGRNRIRRTHKSWIQCFEVNAGLWNLGSRDTCAIIGAISHSLSLYGALEALHLGATLIDLSGRRPDAQLAELGSCNASILYATPSQIKLLFEGYRRKSIAPIRTLRKVFIGGSKLDQQTAAVCRSMFPEAEVHQFYGASETSFIAMSSQETPVESTGKAFPGVEIEIRSSKGNTLDIGMAGEIWVRSPYLFEGYASRERGDAERVAGWISVGEIGWLDSAGNLYIKGRKDRAVQIADRTVHPERMEEYLAGLQGIESSAVVPVEDSLRGASLVAYVKMQSGTVFDAAAILRACRSEFGPGVSPRKIIAMDEWPRLHSGKTDYSVLQASAGR